MFSLVWIMPPRMRTRSDGRPVAELRGGGTGKHVGKGGRGRGPRGGNDDHVDELNGQGNDQGVGANGGVEGVNGNVEGVNGGVGGAPDFSTIIAQQLRNLLPAILAQVGNQGNVGNQNGNIVNENVQENVRNVLVNGNRVGPCFTNPWDLVWQQGAKDYCRRLMQISGALTDEGGENTSAWPKCTPAKTPTMHQMGLVAHASTSTARSHLTKDYRGCRGMWNPVNAENLLLRCYEYGVIVSDHVTVACPRLNRQKD
ncbi:hypothetical protein Tco_0598614 [Tanacetum coccineum]